MLGNLIFTFQSGWSVVIRCPGRVSSHQDGGAHERATWTTLKNLSLSHNKTGRNLLEDDITVPHLVLFVKGDLLYM